MKLSTVLVPSCISSSVTRRAKSATAVPVANACAALATNEAAVT